MFSSSLLTLKLHYNYYKSRHCYQKTRIQTQARANLKKKINIFFLSITMKSLKPPFPGSKPV